MAARRPRAASIDPGSPRVQSGGPRLDLGDLVRGSAVDLNAARLHRLGDFPLQVDDQQAVLEPGAPDLDMVGERELALEIARRDAAMQEGPAFLLVLAALERQDVLLDRQLDLVRPEAGERHRYLEAVPVEAFDVVGGIAFLAHALGGFGEVEQAVEADGRPEQGRKIYSAHSQILLGAKWLRAAPDTSGARLKWRDPVGIPIASWQRRKNS